MFMLTFVHVAIDMIRRLFKDTYWGRLDFLIVDTPPGLEIASQ